MPRPSAQERECGTPREFYHRGMTGQPTPNGTSYGTPSANTDFVSVDDGSARLRYMRLTTGAIASEQNVMSRSGVPLALVLSPFADPVPGEAPIPVVDFSTAGGGGPLRCEHCNAYANPGFKFINGGAQFQCNFCSRISTTPPDHFSPTAPATGQRLDADTRHEFRFGSVEYIVGSADYRMRDPEPASYVFAFDVSASSVSSGLAASAVTSVKAAIAAGMVPGSKAGARIGIITFDRSLHFYDARGAESGRSITMNVVPDVDEAFIPLGGKGFLLSPAEAVATLDSIMEIHSLRSGGTAVGQPNGQNPASMGTGAAAPSKTECAFGAALIAIKVALESSGGKAFVVSGSLPSFGPGKLERRGGAVGGGEEREMGLLRAASPDYEVLGCELGDAQISVDLFLAPAATYVDAATIMRVPRACGGRTYFYGNFDAVRDAASLHRSLCSAVGSVRAFDGLLRVRTSKGIETTGEFLGHFGRPQRGEDVSGPVFDATSSLALEMSVPSKLATDDAGAGGANNFSNGYTAPGNELCKDACIQAAILYTDPAGVRRIRVHTVFALKTSNLSDVFKYADADAVASFFVKRAVSAVVGGGTPLSKAREALVEKTTQALFVYRKHCTTAPLSGQLILPEALKILPVMMLGISKSHAFRPTAPSGQSTEAVSLDERIAALSFLSWASPSDITAMCYPRMYELHRLPPAAGLPAPAPSHPIVPSQGGADASKKPAEPIAMPNTIRASAEVLADDALLLIENGMRMTVWVGPNADRKLVNDVIYQGPGGRLLVRAETAGAAQLTKDCGETGKRIAKIIQRITNEHTALSQPQVAIRQAPGAGGEAKHVMPLLIEDRPAVGGFSYVEFLRAVHKRVMEKLDNESAQNEMQTWEMLNHGY